MRLRREQRQTQNVEERGERRHGEKLLRWSGVVRLVGWLFSPSGGSRVSHLETALALAPARGAS